jgi:putative membrane protein
MRKKMLSLLLAGATLPFVACDSQRASTASETTTTTEAVVNTPPATSPATPAPDTLAEAPSDAGEISAEKAAAATFTTDAEFATKAIESGMAEVKMGNLADRKATSPEVKRFGIQMVQDHTRANNLLIRITQKQKWTTPTEMDVEHQQAYSKLATVMSDEFDQGYMAQMVKDHEMVVAMFQQASTKVTDPELKSFITSTLPSLKMHLGMARDLQKKIEAAR